MDRGSTGGSQCVAGGVGLVRRHLAARQPAQSGLSHRQEQRNQSRQRNLVDSFRRGSRFDFGAGAPDGFEARDPNAPKPSTQPAGTVHKVTFDIVEKQSRDRARRDAVDVDVQR